MTTHPQPKEDHPLLNLQQEWFQPIELPTGAYGKFARELSQQLADLERRFGAHKAAANRLPEGDSESRGLFEG